MQRITIDGAVRDREHGRAIAEAVLAAVGGDMVVRVTPQLVKVDKRVTRVYNQGEPVDGSGGPPVPSA